MRGKFDQVTKTYIYQGVEVSPGMTDDDIQEAIERKQVERIEADGGPYLERFAKELNVKASDLLKNILENNSMVRFSSVRSYEEFKMLKQTLVEDVRPQELAKLSDAIDSYTKLI